MRQTTPKETVSALPSVRDVLVAAREVLQERGWTQGDWEDSRGCVCARGALRVVIPVHALALPRGRAWNLLDEADAALCAVAPKTLPTLHPVAEFNDAPNTTEADIYALYDRAIAWAEGR